MSARDPDPGAADGGGGAAPPVPAALAAALRAWTRRRRAVACGRAAVWGAAGAGALAGAAMALDLAGDPLPWCRVGLAAAAHLALGGGIAAGALRWRAFADRRAEAAALERAAGLAGEPLSGALAIAAAPPPGTSRWMAERTLALAAVAAHALDLRRLAPLRPLLPAAGAAACAALALALAAAADPAARNAAARAALPWRELPAPGDELLAAEPGDVWLAPDAVLAISARSGAPRLQAELAWADGRGEARDLRRDGAVHRLEVGPLRSGLRWRLRGPGLASAWRQATLVEVPRIASVALQVSPPSYAGLPDERVQGGDAQVIAGSNVAIEVVIDTPHAVTAVLVAGGMELPLPLTRSPYGGHFGAARLRVAADLDWHLRLIVPGGAGGVAVEPPQRWRLVCRPDAPPEVSAVADAPVVAPGRAVRIAVAGQDDIALAAMWLEAVGAQPSVRIGLPVPSGARRAEAAATVVPADLGIEPGGRLSLQPVVRDRAGAERRGEPVDVLVAQPAHAARHDLAGRIAAIATAAEAAAAAAADAERAWRAAVRAWRAEDPGAGAPGLRSAAHRARALAAAATEVGDRAEAAAVLPGAPGNLDQIALRAVTLAGGALALAARSGAAEHGAAEAVAGAVEAAQQLVRSADALAGSAALAAGSTAMDAASADADAARDALSGAAAVLAAEWAWIRPTWRPGLRALFWRGREPGAGEPAHRAAEVPAGRDRDVPGLGREGWCARWEGEISVPEAGTWTFRCTADDGVRLRLAGRDLLPAEAWRDQGPTAYQGTAELAAGWHPIVVEFFQGGGGSLLQVEAGRDGPAAIPIERLRHPAQPDRAVVQAMSALPAGAAGAAVARARASGQALLAAADAAGGALAQAARGPRPVGGLAAHAKQAAAAAVPLRAGADWSDVDAVSAAAAAAGTIAAALQEQARGLREACRQDGKGASAGGMAERMRDAAAKPGQGDARRLAGDLAGERTRLAGVAGDALADPAHRAAALAAAWAVDDLAAVLLGSDAIAARAAAAAALPPLALAARHARAAEAAAANAAKGAAAGSLMGELAASPGWPPRLLRSARDRLRQAAAGLRAGGSFGEASAVAAEAAWAAEVEAQRPGAPGAGDLAGAATVLRDLALLPQPEGMADLADFLERCEQRGPESAAAGISRARGARLAAASAALGDTAAGLAGSVQALRQAGLDDLASRAATMADLARTLAAAPDPQGAQGLADTLSGTVAAPLAEALASGRIAAGGAAAQAGRLAAQAAAEAHELAQAAALAGAAPPPAAEDEPWTRAMDASAQGAASAAVDFPEEHRAAIRAYLRRIGDGR